MISSAFLTKGPTGALSQGSGQLRPRGGRSPMRARRDGPTIVAMPTKEPPMPFPSRRLTAVSFLAAGVLTFAGLAANALGVRIRGRVVPDHDRHPRDARADWRAAVALRLHGLRPGRVR